MVAVLNPLAEPVESPRRKRFTRREFDRLMDLGAFDGQRFELIDGDLIDKMGQNPPHAYAVSALLECLMRLFGFGRVRCQVPIEVAEVDRNASFPEPDLIVLAGTTREFGARHPNGSDVLLLVEVADATSRFDLTLKADLYARAGVPEYWVLDVNRRTLYLYRNPLNGRYTHVINAGSTESVAPEAMPEAALAVADMLPAA